jgi:tRNA A-37 threonylcarbamoyl transferase component Bud32
MIGEVIKDFKIIGRLGKGGMGEVWVAEQKIVRTQVAIKLLLAELSGDQQLVQRFFNEAVAVSKIKHAGIVRIYDVGFHGGSAYLIMELLEGETLASRIRNAGRLPLGQIGDLGGQIASVLGATHAAHITHRDLKPDNIFVVQDAELANRERVKILDFGIAKLGTTTGLTATGGMMGTPGYMAPEQWDNAAKVDGSVDVYAVGCIAFKMCCGRPPFEAASIPQAYVQHLKEVPPRIRSLAPDVPHGLDEAIAAALAKRPSDRPSMNELQRVFAALVATYPWVPAPARQAVGDAFAPGAPRRHSEPAITQQDGAVVATRPNKKASGAQAEDEPIAIAKPGVDTLDLGQRTEGFLPLPGAAREAALLQRIPPSEPALAAESEVNRRYGAPASSPQSVRSRASAGRTVAIIGLLAIISGGALIGYAVTRKGVGGMSPAQTAAMARAVGQLDGDIKAARSEIHGRATTLSSFVAVRAVIPTDAESAANLVARGDVAVRDGEVLELGRIVKDANQVEDLLLLPAGATRRSHDGKIGSYAEFVDKEILITEVAKVVPTQDLDKYGGFLSVTRLLALAPAIDALVKAGITGKFVIGRNELAIGMMPAGVTTREALLSSQDGAKIIFAEPPPHAVMPVPVLVGGIGSLLIGLLLLVLGATLRR